MSMSITPLLNKMSPRALVELVQAVATEEKITSCLNVGLDLGPKEEPVKKKKTNGAAKKAKENGSNGSNGSSEKKKTAKSDSDHDVTDVLSYLMRESTEDKYIGASEVAKELNKDTKVVSAALKRLESEEKVTSTGERRGKKYAASKLVS